MSTADGTATTAMATAVARQLALCALSFPASATRAQSAVNQMRREVTTRPGTTVESGASGGTSFYLYSNKLCDELPSELAVTAQTFHESIHEGNSIGTLCGSELSDDGAAYNDDEAIKGKSKN